MEIHQTKLFGHYANTIFGNYSAPMGSYWLEAALRYIAVKHKGGDISAIKPIRVLEQNYGSGTSGNDYVIPYADRQESIFIFRSTITNPLTVDTDGWESVDTKFFRIAEMLSKITPTTMFINTKSEKVIVFVKSPNSVWTRRFTAALPRILKWIYKDGEQWGDDEISLFKAVDASDMDTFNRVINSLCDTIDFRSWKIQKELFGWNNAYRRTRIEDLKNTIARAYSEILTYEKSLAEKRATVDSRKIDLDALINNISDDNSELCDFFNSHKQLEVVKVTKRPESGNTLVYTIIETIDYFDADEFINYYNNKRSYFYSDYITDEARKIYYGIFALNKGRLRTESNFELKNLSSLNPTHDLSNEHNFDAVPHPHLVDYTCLGGNAQYVEKYMTSGDWDMAIEQTIAAAKNIYFGDSGVVASAMEKMPNYMNIKCVIADNGTEMTPTEFLTYIDEENNTNG